MQPMGKLLAGVKAVVNTIPWLVAISIHSSSVWMKSHLSLFCPLTVIPVKRIDSTVGFKVGATVGEVLGEVVGLVVGDVVGLVVGDVDGLVVGLVDGDVDGLVVGDDDGLVVGFGLGASVIVSQ